MFWCLFLPNLETLVLVRIAGCYPVVFCSYLKTRNDTKTAKVRVTQGHDLADTPRRWSCGNITLLGDACHPATPNNGQGACMAIEDALVLATLLAEFWDKPDGHVEAFYLYEVGVLFDVRRFKAMSTVHGTSTKSIAGAVVDDGVVV